MFFLSKKGGGDYISLKRYEEDLAASGILPNDPEDPDADDFMDLSQVSSIDGSEDYNPSHQQHQSHHRGRASAISAAASLANSVKKTTKGRRGAKHKRGNEYENIFENDTSTTALSSTPNSKFWNHLDEFYFRKIKDSDIEFLSNHKLERKSFFNIPQLPPQTQQQLAHSKMYQNNDIDESLLPSGPDTPSSFMQDQSSMQMGMVPPPQSSSSLTPQQQSSYQSLQQPVPQFISPVLSSLPISQQQQINKEYSTVGPFTQRLLAAFLETPRTPREDVTRLKSTYGDNPDTPEYRYFLEQGVKSQLEKAFHISSKGTNSSSSSSSSSSPSSPTIGMISTAPNTSPEDDEVCEELRLTFRMLKRHQRLLKFQKNNLLAKMMAEKECQDKREKDKRDTFAMIRLYREREQHRKGREKHGRHK